ncbi:MAG: flavin reductase family protein [Thermoplasmata archaeon]
MSGPGVDPSDFRRLMARWPTGVSVVTARSGERDGGMTVNALLSVTLEPPTLLVSLARDADTVPLLDASGAFAVSFLGARQRELSERFARRLDAEEKFRGVRIRRGVTGAALLEGALGWIECRRLRAIPLTDHLLYVGEVVAVQEGTDAPPLLFYRRSYAAAEGVDRLILPSAPADRSSP